MTDSFKQFLREGATLQQKSFIALSQDLEFSFLN
jgi:hypothetical protein